jgi:D-glycero-D-manno-heptose 1,7-bisphosphate phosphatase
MNKAIFLDRDGVINKERGEYTWQLSDFEFNDGLFEALSKLKNFLFIIITNQGGIAKGIYNHYDVEKTNTLIINSFAKNNLKLTDIFYCPHHSDYGKCLCRKPNSLMLEKAIARYNIDVKSSYFIGDTQRDIDAGKKVGLNTIKINPNDNLLKYISKIR